MTINRNLRKALFVTAIIGASLALTGCHHLFFHGHYHGHSGHGYGHSGYGGHGGYGHGAYRGGGKGRGHKGYGHHRRHHGSY